jgi:hypothetical protein
VRPGETKSPRKPPRTEATRTKHGSGAVSSSQTTRGGNKVGRGSSPTGTHPRPDAPREATVRASRNRNGTEQAVALISERPGHRLSRVFRRPPWRSELPPGGGAVRSYGADARTSRHPGRKLTCTRREAQSPEAQTYLYLSLGGAPAHEASGAEQRPWDESQRAPRSDLPSLASDWAPLRCIGTRRSAATEGTSPAARSDLPTHERECAPDAPQVRNGQGRSLPPLF